MNRVTISGRLVADPKLGAAGDTPLAEFRLANNRGPDRDAEFFSVTSFGPLAERIAQRAKKGQEVVIDGRLRQQSWTDSEDTPRSSVDVLAKSIVFGAYAKGPDHDSASEDVEVEPETVVA